MLLSRKEKKIDRLARCGVKHVKKSLANALERLAKTSVSTMDLIGWGGEGNTNKCESEMKSLMG